MSPRVVPPRAALEAIGDAAGLREGWAPVHFRRGDRDAITWHRLGVDGAADLLARTVLERSMTWSDEAIIGLPQRKRWSGGVAGASLLWCMVAGSDQLARARRFRPLPSIVVQEGGSSRRWLMWRLAEWVDYFELAAANRRLAYAVRAVQRHGDPDGFACPAPGTFLRVGRSRPVAVSCVRLTDAVFSPGAVVDRLREPPPKDAWLTG